MHRLPSIPSTVLILFATLGVIGFPDSAEGTTLIVEIIDSTITWTGYRQTFSQDYVKFIAMNSTLQNTQLHIPTATHFKISDCTLINMALDIGTTGLSGNATLDTDRVFHLTGNTFSFTDASTNHLLNATDATIDLDLSGWATSTSSATSNFEFNSNTIGLSSCSPLSYYHVDDRYYTPPSITTINRCHPHAVKIDGSAATTTMMIAEADTKSVQTCTDGLSTVAYATTHMNSGMYGGFNSSYGCDVKINGTTCCNAFCSDNCVLESNQADLQSGRYVDFVTTAFDSLTGKLEIELKAEIHEQDAVWIHTDATYTDLSTVATSGKCTNRAPITVPSGYAAVHTDYNTRFPSYGHWTNAGTSEVTVGSQTYNTTTYRASLSYEDITACSSSTAQPVVLVIRVIHSRYEGDLTGTPTTVSDTNPLTLNVFFYREWVVTAGALTTTAGSIFHLFQYPTTRNAGDVTFSMEMCVPVSGGSNAAMRFDGNLTSTTVNHGSGSACAAEGSMIPTCTSATTWTFTDTTCRNSTNGDAVLGTGYCCQRISVVTDKLYNDIAETGGVVVETRTNGGVGSLLQPDRSVTITLVYNFIASGSTNLISGLTGTLQTYAAASVMRPVHQADDSGSVTTSYNSGDTVYAKVTLNGLNYTLTDHNDHQIDISRITLCSVRNTGVGSCSFTALNPSTPEITGCSAYVPCENQVVKVMDIQSSSCNVDNTLTTPNNFLCVADAGVKMQDHSYIFGRCDNTGALCLTEEGSHLGNFFGSTTCTEGQSCHPNSNHVNNLDEISGLHADWGKKWCNSLTNYSDIVDCTSSEAVCHANSKCSKIGDHALFSIPAPLHTYGSAATAEPVNLEARFVIYLGNLTATAINARRRLLSVEESEYATEARQKATLPVSLLQQLTTQLRDASDHLQKIMDSKEHGLSDDDAKAVSEFHDLVDQVRNLNTDNAHDFNVATLNALHPAVIQAQNMLNKYGAPTAKSVVAENGRKLLSLAHNTNRQVFGAASSSLSTRCATPDTIPCKYIKANNGVSGATCATAAECDSARRSSIYGGGAFQIAVRSATSTGDRASEDQNGAEIRSVSASATLEDKKTMESRLQVVGFAAMGFVLVLISVFAVAQYRAARNKEQMADAKDGSDI